MTPARARYAVVAFVLLSAGVAMNIMMFQDGPGSTRGRRPAAPVVRQAVEAPEPAQAPGTAGNHALLLPTPAVQPSPTTGQAAPISEMQDLIATIQRELQVRGYEPGTPDGVAGAVTRAAIMAWEHDRGLSPTGEPTEAIMKAIVLGVSGQSAQQITAEWQALPKDKRSRTETLVRSVQQQLSALGYNLGKVTGQVNEDTARAIREFETDQRLTPTGRISGPLVARLAKLTSPGRSAASTLR